MLHKTSKTLSGLIGSQAKSRDATTPHHEEKGKDVAGPDQGSSHHRRSKSTSPTGVQDDAHANPHPAVRPLNTKLRPRSPVQPLYDASYEAKSEVMALEEKRLSSSSQRNSRATEPDELATAVSQIDLNNTPATTTQGSGEEQNKIKTESDVDYVVDYRPAVVHENIRPHTHTIYQPRRVRSFHFEEHRTYIQPIKDPEPKILPAQHWVKDPVTGALRKV